MQIKIENGVVIARAETIADNQTLLALGTAKTKEVKSAERILYRVRDGKPFTPKGMEQKETRIGGYKVKCDICGEKHRTGMPMKVHKARIHGIKRTVKGVNTPCEVCGKMVKGKRGLGTHKSTMHGIKSPSNLYWKVYQERKAQGLPAIGTMDEVRHRQAMMIPASAERELETA